MVFRVGLTDFARKHGDFSLVQFLPSPPFLVTFGLLLMGIPSSLSLLHFEHCHFQPLITYSCLQLHTYCVISKA